MSFIKSFCILSYRNPNEPNTNRAIFILFTHLHKNGTLSIYILHKLKINVNLKKNIYKEKQKLVALL